MNKDSIFSAVIAAVLGGSPALVYVGTLKSDVQHLSDTTKELTIHIERLNEKLENATVDIAIVKNDRMCKEQPK